MDVPKCIIENVEINELKQSQYNPRKDLKPGDIEYEKLKKSIKTFGYVEPIVWNKNTGNIVGGHQRAKVLQDLGYEKATCIVVDLDDENEKALNIALNKINGEWDIPLLTDLLKGLDDSDFDVTLTGFDAAELGELFGEADPDELQGDDFDLDDELESDDPLISKLGDVWTLGKPRLMCGDSTTKEDVTILINGIPMDMCFTDPHYNVNYDAVAVKIMNDNMKDDTFLKFLISSFEMISYALKPGGSYYICHADSEGLNFRLAVRESGLLMKQCLIWIKNTFVMGRQDYHWQHEPILYGWKEGAAHYFTADRTQSTVIEELKKLDVKKLKRAELVELLMRITTDTTAPTSVIRENKPSRNAEHPTMKPIRLCARCIQNSSRQGENVIDLFGGSGSTLIAAEQINRVSYLMELDPKFCDVIVRRFIKTFGSEEDVFLEREGVKKNIKEL